VRLYSPQRGFCKAPVMKNLRFDVAPDWEMANTICCHNTKYAEPSGYFDTARVRLFSRFKTEEKSHTFYDAVCGVPLFIAPVGRSMSAWEDESTEHGWPSFRPAEVVAQNVRQLSNGEVRSVCGTHLGANSQKYSLLTFIVLT
jgi:peptide methionine sulfoxide reductase MsrB